MAKWFLKSLLINREISSNFEFNSNFEENECPELENVKKCQEITKSGLGNAHKREAITSVNESEGCHQTKESNMDVEENMMEWEKAIEEDASYVSATQSNPTQARQPNPTETTMRPDSPPPAPHLPR